MEFQTRPTRNLRLADVTLTCTECSEPDCGMTVMVERDELAAGRKVRCVACLMKTKLRTQPIG